jgi:pyruvate kinase
MKKTKMVCTIGPKSESKEMLTKLVNIGMNVIRLNFSHGDYNEHGARISAIREVMKETGKKVAILLDTKGPEIRTIKLEGGQDVTLEAGQEFTITTDKSVVGNKSIVAVTYAAFATDLKVGDTVLIDDGLLNLTVIEKDDVKVKCTVNNTADLGENKGVNLPGVNVNLPALAEKDKNDLVWGCQQGIDFVAASFIRKKEDIIAIRELLEANGGKAVKIIAKIENQEGLDNFDEILEVADGIMVARGDLGVEIPMEEVPFAQKMMIQKCNEAGKMVITATQMLDSMIKNPRPTRAEVGDVANAILDGTDAVMLSGESAKGKYPEIAVQTMAKICERTDRELDKYGAISYDNEMTVTEAIARGAVEAAENLNAKAIVVLTESGTTARNIRKSFPTAKIIALTTNETTANQLMLSRGVYPVMIDAVNEAEAFFQLGLKVAAEQEFVQDGDVVVLTAGINSAVGTTNTIKVEVVKK